MPIYRYLYIYACVRICLTICGYIMYIHTHMYTHVSLYIHVYICIYIYIYKWPMCPSSWRSFSSSSRALYNSTMRSITSGIAGHSNAWLYCYLLREDFGLQSYIFGPGTFHVGPKLISRAESRLDMSMSPMESFWRGVFTSTSRSA